MALKRLDDIPVGKAEKSSKAAKPSVNIHGIAVKAYVEALDALRIATANKASTEQPVLEAGSDLIFKTNLGQPASPVTSVEVTDDSGATAQVQFKNQYGAVDGDVVSEVFKNFKGANGRAVDVNDFVHETIKASFDSSVFMVDGSFSKERFDVFKTAIDKVAATLNVQSPLTCKKLVTAKPSFHEARWAAIPNIAAQRIIQQTLPATVAGRKVCDATVQPAPVVATTAPIVEQIISSRRR